MALRVWLPLNGNLENKGLSNINVSANGSFVDNGKLGKGYTGNKITMSQNFLTKTGTICFWIKVGAEVASSPSPNQIFASSGSYGRKWDLFLYNGKNSFHSWGCVKDSSTGTPNGSYTLSNVFPNDTWVHVAVSHDENNQYIYLNGILSSTITWDSSGTFTFDGVCYFANTPTGVIYNDLRIYDECLSQKQIKEISKGLVAHYKLDGPKAHENLILRSDKITGSGQASGITCTSMSDNSYKIVATSGNGNWCRLFFAEDSNTNVGNKLSVGDTYTISCDIKVEEGTAFPTLFINNGNGYKQLGGPTLKLNTWQRVYYTSTWNEPGTSYGNIALHLGFSGAIGTYYFKNFKLEKGSFTPWIPAPTDPMYTSLGYVNDIGIDCSGNGYFLTDTDSSSIISTDSARYSTCVQRTSPTKGIGKIPTIFSLNQQINEITLCGWWKTTVSDTNTKNLIALGQNSFIRFGGSSNTNVWTYVKMGGTNQALTATGPSLIDDKWHFLVTTFKNGVITTYADGQQTGTIDKSSVATTLSCDAVGGYIGSYNGTTENVGGSISDCRIYATALSADDILTMYKNSGIIDNKGNVYAYEFKEE